MPTKDELLEQIRRRAERIEAEEQEQQVDWVARRDWWQKQVTSLFDHLSTLLKPLADAGKMRTQRVPLHLSEQTLGSYQTESLEFWIGHKRVLLKPVASVIVGGVGRVDVDGPRGTARLILATPEGLEPKEYMTNAKWHVTSPRRTGPLEEMEDVTFLELFSSLIGLQEA